MALKSKRAGPAAPNPVLVDGARAPTSAIETVGLVAGVLGLTAIVFAFVLYVIDPGAWVLALANAIFAAVGLASYLLTHLDAIRRLIFGRTTSLVLAESILLAGILLLVVAVNYFASRATLEWDLTRDGLFTLTPQSEAVLAGLKKPVRVLGFFEPSDATRARLAELVELYQRHTDQLTLEFMDADSVPPSVAKKYKLGAEEAPIVVTADDARFIKMHVPTEQEMTNALVKLTERPVRKIYFVTGHGESGAPTDGEIEKKTERGHFRAVEAMRDEGFEVASLVLASTSEVPKDANLVFIAGARAPLFPGEIETLSKYLDAGGRAFVLLDAGMGEGLGTLLKDRGIEVSDTWIVEEETAVRALGFGKDAVAVREFEPHPITRSLVGRILLFDSVKGVLPIIPTAGVSVSTLLRSSATSWAEANYREAGELVRGPDDVAGPVPFAVAHVRSVAALPEKRTDETRLLVIGDSSFASDRHLMTGANLDFFLNSVRWLLGEEKEITIRPTRRSATRIVLTHGQLTGIVFLSVNFIPMAFVGVGFSIWAIRQRR